VDSTTVTKRRNFLRFRLRTLIIAITLLAIVLGIFGRIWYRNYQQSLALKLIRDLQGVVLFSRDQKIDRIYLSGEQITDQVLATLVRRLRYLPDVRELDLVSTSISDDGLLLVAALPHLKVVYVHESPVSDKGIAQLRKLAPNLAIKLEAPDPIATQLAMRRIYRKAIIAHAWSPQGDWFATGNGEGMLSLWTLHGEQTAAIKAHDEWLFSIAINSRGDLIATGGGDNCIRLWDSRNVELLGELRGHTDDVHAVAFAADGMLVSTGDDHTVRIWNVSQRRCLRVLTGHTGTVPAISVSLDGSLIASASRDNTIRLWDVQTGIERHILQGHDDDVSGVAFVGEQLVSASYDGTLRWWDVKSGECLRVVRVSNDRLYSFAVDPMTDDVIFGDAAELLRSVSTKSLACRTLHRGSIFAHLGFSPDARWLAGTTAEGSIQLFDAHTRGRRYSIQPIAELELAQVIQE